MKTNPLHKFKIDDLSDENYDNIDLHKHTEQYFGFLHNP